VLIEMTVGISGPEYCLNPGDRREFPQDEAQRLIAAGFAVPVADRPMERAVTAPVVETREAAASRRQKGRR
jgi:hypothetical protein